MTKLALFGGPKMIKEPFRPYNSIGQEEALAVREVMESGKLSDFYGSCVPQFYGGTKIQAFEKSWASFFNVEKAVTVNSNTSGLIAALGAIGIEPGDEVIVSPWTMSASATSILVWNAIPVFADIEEETFNLNPLSVENSVTPHTKAILVPDIFGHAADLDAIMKIARKHDLKVIEDCAQAPGALYHGKYAGTVADIGVFSLNFHKHIHTGEGGVCVTNDSELAERLQLIRNHAEAVVEKMEISNLTNMIGFNFRLTEIQAAIGIEQLKKLDMFNIERVDAARRLDEGLAELEGLKLPVVQENCSHVYYVYSLVFDEEVTKLNRDLVAHALIAEGVPVSQGYLNLHMLPMYQNKTAYGRGHFPWGADFYKGAVSYDNGICPIAEKLHEKTYLGLGMCSHRYTQEETSLIIDGFKKIWDNLEVLRESEFTT